MESNGLRFVRNQDFQVTAVLNPDDPDRADEFVNAIAKAKPGFMGKPVLLLEIYQPLVGVVHETILHMCRYGIKQIKISTLIAHRPEIEQGHVNFTYDDGKVIEHYMVMSKDVMDGEDFMVHYMTIAFHDGSVLNNEYSSTSNVLQATFGRQDERRGNQSD